MGWFSGVTKALGVLNPVALLGTALAGGGEAYSAYEQSKSVKDTNAMNQLMARESMGFSASQADKQMAFQERMSNTSHQRQIADLKAAGLNPLLSATSGADSPGGASGSGAVSTSQPVPSRMLNMLTSGKDLLRLRADLNQQKQSSELIKAQRVKTDTDSIGSLESNKSLRLENELLDMRNDFFKKNPWAFKLNAASGGINSAGSILRLLK